ncbi:cell division protein FtsA [Patescibacteria group bacterium]|nr:cell division protein FtsA [Patescibacteria group bacterium]MBU1933918.1 cell division protein FtsA [Patescibacteria group bacterium]MBU2233342.1 cell division protein FtsA [Patescibacteria group bacterium]MBU2264499.1 cell division protein FtsA [Patescibacteria group bacterium]
MRDNIIAGLDIGSTSIRLVAGQKTTNESGEQLQILGAVTVPAEGINRGAVNSIEDATSAISACLEKAERLIGVPITNVWVGINGPNLKCEKSQGVVAVGRSDNEITEDDVNRAVEAAQALSVPPNYEILHVIPVRFAVDNQEDIKDPISMTGVRLEVETLIIQGLSSQIKNLTKAIYRTGLEIEDLVLSPLAAAEVVIGAKQKELGAALINIGSSTTSLAVFEEGELLHAAIIPIGSEHITADVAIGLRCPINLAERIKIEHGSAKSDKFTKKDEVDISELIKEESIFEDSMVISKKYVAEIIEARVEEIFEKIDNELKKIDRSGMLPAGVFLIGSGAKLNDLVEAAKNKLRLPACLGVNQNISLVIDKVNDVNYLTALGLVAWGNQLTKRKKHSKISWLTRGAAGKGLEQIKEWFKSLIP